MKMADILRDIADLLDQKIGGNDPAADNTTQQRMEPADVPEPELDDNPVMVPPLQAKLEILKKSEELPNVYDDKGQGQDELAAIRKNAGLTACQQETADDEPLDN